VETNGQRVTVLDSSVIVAADGIPVTVTGGDGQPALIPLGAHCWGAEPDSHGARTVTIDHDTYDNGVTVIANAAGGVQPLQITITNTFDPAELTVTKVAVNPPAGDATYTFDISCVVTAPDGTSVPVPLLVGTSPVGVAAGQSVSFTVLAGSRCRVTETGNAGATVTFVESGGAPDGNPGDGVITVVTDASVVVTNTYPSTNGGGVLPPTGISDLDIALRLAEILIIGGLVLSVVPFVTRRRRRV
jgi:hypothetical protein